MQRTVLVVGLALSGCQAPALSPVVLADHGERLLAAPATLTAVVGDAAMRGYHTQYLRLLDWTTAEGTLSNSDASLAPMTRTASATVNAENSRQASLSYSPLKAGGGYSLSVALKRPDISGTPVTVATGTVSGLTLAVGANPVNVPLSPTANGHLATSVSQSVVPVPIIERVGATSLIAGTGVYGTTNGSLGVATFSSPQSLAFKNDSLFISDSAANVIRHVNLAVSSGSGGYVSTYAGAAGVAGFVNGTASAARFNDPLGLVMRSNGHMMVADSGNRVIRLIDTSLAPTDANFVRTLAGSGVWGNADGSATTATFATPTSMVVSSTNQLFVSDINGHRIRKINLNLAPSDGNYVTTFAGSGVAASTDGTGTAASFNGPCGIAIDDDDNIYVTEDGGMRVRKITPAGVVTTIAGGVAGTQDGSKAVATFGALRDVVYSGHRLYVTDTSHTIRVIRLYLPTTDPNYVDTIAGLGGTSGYVEGSGAAARFFSPHGLELGPDGNLYVTDNTNRRVRKVE